MSQEEMTESRADSRHEMFDPRTRRSGSPPMVPSKEQEEQRQAAVNPFNFIEK